MIRQDFVEPLKEICLQAGEIVMDYYNNGAKIEIKEDDTPVTEADIAANEYIVSELKKLAPEIPIVAEESKNSVDSGNAKQFWLVDPIDGTKSFIKRTGQFTVNIGLIEYKKPLMGVIFVPAKDVLYFTDENGKAMRKKSSENPEEIVTRNPGDDGLIVVASASHQTPETKDFIDNLPKVDRLVSASSSLKFCLVAEGEADVYPRFGPTSEWDIAAGHAILNAAGGSVTTEKGDQLLYGKEDYLNGYFIAWGERK